MLSSTLPIALYDTLPACLTIRPQVSSQDPPKYIPSTFASTLPGMLPRTLSVVLDGTHPACLTVRSHTSSQEAFKQTPEHALKYTPNCTRWHSQPAWLYAPKSAHTMLPSTLRVRSQVHSRACSQGRSHWYSMAHTQPAWLYVLTPALKKLSSTLPIALDDTPSLHDYTLPSQLTSCSQVHSEYVLKYTPGHALKDAPNCTRWHTPSLLGSTLPSTLSRGKAPDLVWLYASMYAPGCSIQRLAELQEPGTRRRVAGDGWPMAHGVWWLTSWSRSISYSKPYH